MAKALTLCSIQVRSMPALLIQLVLLAVGVDFEQTVKCVRQGGRFVLLGKEMPKDSKVCAQVGAAC